MSSNHALAADRKKPRPLKSDVMCIRKYKRNCVYPANMK